MSSSGQKLLWKAPHNWNGRPFQCQRAQGIVPKFTLVWLTIHWIRSNSGNFHNMSQASWEISPSAPTNSLLCPSKMGFRLLKDRKNCWTYVERHLLGLERTPVITVKWNYLISSQNAPSSFWHSHSDSLHPADAEIRGSGCKLLELYQINLTGFLVLCLETFACVRSAFREWINRSPTFSSSPQGCNDAWNYQVKPLLIRAPSRIETEIIQKLIFELSG